MDPKGRSRLDRRLNTPFTEQRGASCQKVHDLVAVSRQLASVDSDWKWDEEDLSDLSSGAVMARYPGFETTAEDAAELINLACWANAGCAVALADPARLSLAGMFMPAPYNH